MSTHFPGIWSLIKRSRDAGKPSKLERLLTVGGQLMYVTSNDVMLTEVIFKILAFDALNLKQNQKIFFHFI